MRCESPQLIVMPLHVAKRGIRLVKIDFVYLVADGAHKDVAVPVSVERMGRSRFATLRVRFVELFVIHPDRNAFQLGRDPGIEID